MNGKAKSMIYKKVDLYHQDMGKYSEIVKEYSEMTEFQRDFLCGLLKQKKPNKVLV